MKRILVVDDEVNMTEILQMLLKKDGYSVAAAADGGEAIRRLKNGEAIDLIISDLRMPKVDGMGILEFLQRTNRKIPFVIITAYGSIESAVEAMKHGATDFITKPFNKDIIRHIVHRILQVETLKDQNALLLDSVRNVDIVFKSAAMGSVMEVIKKVSATNTPVLITGESGTGKSLVARVIHAFSEPQGEHRPFVRINCPGIPETLFESELFGYQRGAFTGAERDFKGKVRMADGGTLFLDEVAEFPLNAQAKLLRLLEEKDFEPLGSTTTINIDTRVICATNRNPKELIKSHLFREDLYYRINAIIIDIPPLRERKEDIPVLARHFLERLSRELGRETKGLAWDAERALFRYDWPGNVRELHNVLERAMVLSSAPEIQVGDLALDLATPSADNSGEACGSLDAMERKLLSAALQRTGWNVAAAAIELGITRSTLRYRVKKHGLARG